MTLPAPSPMYDSDILSEGESSDLVLSKTGTQLKDLAHSSVVKNEFAGISFRVTPTKIRDNLKRSLLQKIASQPTSLVLSDMMLNEELDALESKRYVSPQSISELPISPEALKKTSPKLPIQITFDSPNKSQIATLKSKSPAQTTKIDQLLKNPVENPTGYDLAKSEIVDQQTSMRERFENQIKSVINQTKEPIEPKQPDRKQVQQPIRQQIPVEQKQPAPTKPKKFTIQKAPLAETYRQLSEARKPPSPVSVQLRAPSVAKKDILALNSTSMSQQQQPSAMSGMPLTTKHVRIEEAIKKSVGESKILADLESEKMKLLQQLDVNQRQQILSKSPLLRKQIEYKHQNESTAQEQVAQNHFNQHLARKVFIVMNQIWGNTKIDVLADNFQQSKQNILKQQIFNQIRGAKHQKVSMQAHKKLIIRIAFAKLRQNLEQLDGIFQVLTARRYNPLFYQVVERFNELANCEYAIVAAHRHSHIVQIIRKISHISQNVTQTNTKQREQKLDGITVVDEAPRPYFPPSPDYNQIETYLQNKLDRLTQSDMDSLKTQIAAEMERYDVSPIHDLPPPQPEAQPEQIIKSQVISSQTIPTIVQEDMDIQPPVDTGFKSYEIGFINCPPFSHLQTVSSGVQQRLVTLQKMLRPQKQQSVIVANPMLDLVVPTVKSYYLGAAMRNWLLITRKKALFREQTLLATKFNHFKTRKRTFRQLLNLFYEKRHFSTTIQTARDSLLRLQKKLFFSDFTAACAASRLEKSKLRYFELLTAENVKRKTLTTWLEQSKSLLQLQRCTKMRQLRQTIAMNTQRHTFTNLRSNTKANLIRQAQADAMTVKHQYALAYVAFCSWQMKSLAKTTAHEELDEIIANLQPAKAGQFLVDQCPLYAAAFKMWRLKAVRRVLYAKLLWRAQSRNRLHQQKEALTCWRAVQFSYKKLKYEVMSKLKNEFTRISSERGLEDKCSAFRSQKLIQRLFTFIKSTSSVQIRQNKLFSVVQRQCHRNMMQNVFKTMLFEYKSSEKQKNHIAKITANYDNFVTRKYFFLLTILTAQRTVPDILLNLKLKNQTNSFLNPRYQFQKVFINPFVAIKAQLIKEIAIRMEAVPDLRPDTSLAVTKLRELKMAMMSPEGPNDSTKQLYNVGLKFSATEFLPDPNAFTRFEPDDEDILGQDIMNERIKDKLGDKFNKSAFQPRTVRFDVNEKIDNKQISEQLSQTELLIAQMGDEVDERLILLQKRLQAMLK